MFKCDYHTHSMFSFDGMNSPDELCEAAIARGVTDLAITDHFECNLKADGAYAEYNADAAYESIAAAKEKYKNKMNLSYGIELGQLNQYPEEAERLLGSYDFDFVIGSIHNLFNAPDFYYYDFTKIDNDDYISLLFEKNIKEICDVIDICDRIDTVAHLTYMHRYVAMAGKRHDFTKHFESVSKLYEKMISKGVALEVNVSTLWRGLGFTMPTADFLALYKECGGKLVTVGTDSHGVAHVGECIEDGFALLRSIGLNDVLVVRNGEKTIKKI